MTEEDHYSSHHIITNETQPDEEGSVDDRLKVSKQRKFSDRSKQFGRLRAASQGSELCTSHGLLVEENPRHPWTIKRKEVEPPAKPPKRFTDTYFRKLDVAKDKKTRHSIRDMPADAPYPLNVYDRDYLI